MPPEPPRRGVPIGRITELVTATAPHTPVPPPNDATPTARPPADPRPPPAQYARPRTMVRAPSVGGPPPLPATDTDEHTLAGIAPPSAPPDEPDRDSGLIAADGTFRLYQAEHARAEALAAELVAAKREATPEERPSSPPTGAQWRSLLYKLVAAVLALVAAATVGIEAYTQYVKLKVDVLSAKVTAQEVVTKPLPGAAASADKSADACREWARATDDYHRQIFSKLGVIIPPQPNAMPVTEIKTRAAVRKPNAVTGAPVLEVLTLPPALP